MLTKLLYENMLGHCVIGLLPGSLSESHEIESELYTAWAQRKHSFYLLLFRFLKAGRFNLDILNKIIFVVGAVGALYDA